MKRVPVILVTGPSGTGKTVACWEIREILIESNVPHAFVDLDNLRWCYVPGSRDKYNTQLVAKNLSAVWANFSYAGAKCLVLSGVVENSSDIQTIRDAVPGSDITVYRLVVDDNTLESRMRQRERGRGLERNLARARELTAIMSENQVEDHIIRADRDLDSIAREIISLSGWIA